MGRGRRRRSHRRMRACDDLFAPRGSAAAFGSGSLTPPSPVPTPAPTPTPLPPPPPPPPASAPEPETESGRLWRLARDAEQGGRLDEAMELHRQIVALEPPNVDSRLALARLQERLGNPDQAISTLAEGIERLPEQTEFLVLRGAMLSRRKRYPEAESDLRHALLLQPSHGPAHFDLALILWRKGLVTEAAEAFNQALTYQPDSTTYAYLGEALNQTGQLGEAMAALERSLQLEPRQTRAYQLMGRVLDRLNRPEEAMEMYRRGREMGAP